MSILVAEWLLQKYEWTTCLLRKRITITQLFQQKKPQSNDWGFTFSRLRFRASENLTHTTLNYASAFSFFALGAAFAASWSAFFLITVVPSKVSPSTNALP